MLRVALWVIFAVEAFHAAALYFIPPLHYYNGLHLQNFDYGILYNSTELLSRAQDLFLTTRGIHAWADNQDYFQILLAPLHLLPNPHYGLLLTHSLAIYSVGLLVAWDLRRMPTVALLVAPFVWLSPFMLNMNLDLVHTEAFATVMLLGMFFAARRGARATFFVFLLLALSCKEDVAITAAWFMVLAWFRPSLLALPRSVYVAGLVISIAAFAINQNIVLPYYKVQSCNWLSDGYLAAAASANPASPFFQNLANSLTDPAFLANRLFASEAAVYLALLFAPILPFARATFPLVLLPLAGAGVNLIGGGYLILAAYHYDHSTFAGVIMVLLLGFRQIAWKHAVAALLATVAVATNLLYQHNSTHLTHPWRASYWQFDKNVATRFVELANERLPKDIVISADFNSVNYLLAGRSSVYMFENPFRADYFGVYGACDESVAEMTRVPLADLVILRNDIARNQSGEILARDYIEFYITIGRDEFHYDIYVRKDSPRRDELVPLVEQLRSAVVSITARPAAST